jgi:hypothetical protein
LFEPTCDRQGDRGATLEQGLYILRCVPYALGELAFREITFPENIGDRVAWR